MRPHVLSLPLLLVAPLVAASASGQPDPVASAVEALDAVSAAGRLRPGVVVTLTVVTHGRTADEAAERNATRMVRLLAALRRQAAAGAAVVPTGLVMAREGEWDGAGRAPRDSLLVTEFAARHGVRVTLHDLTALGALVDTSLAAGATGVAGIALAAPDDLALQLRAAEVALRSARDEMADRVAPAEGRLRRLFELGLMVRALSCR